MVIEQLSLIKKEEKHLEMYPHQVDVFNEVLKHLEKTDKICTQAPTGFGKTILSIFLINHFLKQNKNIFFMVNRSALVMQTYKYFEWTASIIKAGYEEYFSPDKKIQIVMLQTWYSRRNKINIIPDIVIWDEAHLGTSKNMFNEFVARFPMVKFIGLTATPLTEKGHKLPFFEKTISKYQTKDLIKAGFLSPYRMFALPVDIDLKKIKTSAGDFDEGQLSEEMRQSRVVLHIMTAIEKHISNQKTMVFCVDIDHARSTYNELLFRNKTVGIMHSLRSEKENDKTLEQFKKGEIQFLVNVSMLTIGFDMPDVEALVIARPTKVLRLYLQIIGRGLRIYPGKKDCLILDCGLLYQRHGLPDEVRDWSLLQQPTKKENEIVSLPYCLSCDLALINLICPDCAKEHFCCRRCRGVFFKVKDETGKSICFECLLELAKEEEAREEEARRMRELQEKKEFDLIQVTEKYKALQNNTGEVYFQDYGDPEFQTYLKIIGGHEKSRAWRSGAANYRFGKLLFLAAAKKITMFRLKQLLTRALDKKYHPDWVLFQIDEHWKEILGNG